MHPSLEWALPFKWMKSLALLIELKLYVETYAHLKIVHFVNYALKTTMGVDTKAHGWIGI